jgi:uncharacterized protein YjbI with pentapeptide repeats
VSIFGLPHRNIAFSNLHGENLTKTRFVNCSFDNANMRNVIAIGVPFNGICTFRKADIRGANFRGATNDNSTARLETILLNQAGCIERTKMPGGTTSNARPCK